MKRHIRDDRGRLLQLDKKWKDLRTRQQEWIAEELRTRYLKAYDEEGREPSKQVCVKKHLQRREEALSLLFSKDLW